MEQLLQLLKSNPPTTTVGSLAQLGSGFSITSFLSFAPWIIDSSVSSHMNSISNWFQTYVPCPGNKKVRTADGSLSPIAEKGSIPISENIELQLVLHVPKLACNLLSVSKLSKDSNFCVTFFDSHCKFHDRRTGKMTGSARMQDGLYYFNEKISKNKQVQSFVGSVSSLFACDKIMLWHFRLGHPSFFYLKHLFPGLFRGWL